MKICLIARCISLTWGGIERISVSLARGLADAGHEVRILTTKSDTQIPGVTISVLPVSGPFSAGRMWSFQRAARRVVEDGGFDVVYGICRVYPVDIYRAGDGLQVHWMRLRHPNALIRAARYLTSPVNLLVRQTEERLFRNSGRRLFITNSRLLKEQIHRYYAVPEDKIKVIYNGVDHALFNPGVKTHRTAMRAKYGIESDATVVLYAANNWSRKGLATIIRALPRMGTAKVRVVIVGRGKERHYRKLAQAQGLPPDALVFAGHTTGIEMFYGMSDLFVLPSMYEPFSNVCLEAMASGLPVVTTAANGACELITPGEDGYVLTDWADDAELARHMAQIIAGGQLAKMGDNAAQKALQFSWDRHLEELQALLANFARS